MSAYTRWMHMYVCVSNVLNIHCDNLVRPQSFHPLMQSILLIEQIPLRWLDLYILLHYFFVWMQRTAAQMVVVVVVKPGWKSDSLQATHSIHHINLNSKIRHQPHIHAKAKTPERTPNQPHSFNKQTHTHTHTDRFIAHANPFPPLFCSIFPTWVLSESKRAVCVCMCASVLLKFKLLAVFGLEGLCGILGVPFVLATTT